MERNLCIAKGNDRQKLFGNNIGLNNLTTNYIKMYYSIVFNHESY